MSNAVKFYAIRIKGTDFYKCSKHLHFASFKDAIAHGVFFNQRKNAEKTVRANTKQLAAVGYPINYSQFIVCNENEDKYYSGMKQFVDSQSELYPIEHWNIELEIVELNMTIAGIGG